MRGSLRELQARFDRRATGRETLAEVVARLVREYKRQPTAARHRRIVEAVGALRRAQGGAR